MRIHFFTKLPPPLTGQTLGSQIVYSHLISENYKTYLYNISVLSELKKEKYNLVYTIKFFLVFFRELFKLRNNIISKDVVYFIPASSFLGLLKDLIFCFFLRNDIRLVAHVRSGNLPNIYNSKYYRLFTKYIINKVTQYIFLSEILSQSASTIPELKKVFVKNPIDSEIVGSLSELNNRIDAIKNRKTEKLNIIFISNMIKTKGYLDLLMSSKYLQFEKDCEFNFFFLGKWRNKNDEKDFLMKIQEIEKMRNINCTYMGSFDSRKKIKNILQKSDIFCLPTYYPVEAQPRSIIEAMSNGLPIISTNHASIPEVVSHNVNGFLIEPKDPKKIAESILQYRNKEFLIEHSNASYHIYNSEFSEKKLLNLLTKHITG